MKAFFHRFDRLISYNEQIFTTIYIDPLKGPLYWASHKNRLIESCQYLFKLNAASLLEKIEKEFLDKLLRSKKNGRARIRLYFFNNKLRALGYFDTPPNLSHTSFTDFHKKIINSGFSIYKHYRDPHLPNFIKIPNYFPYSLEKKELLLESVNPHYGIVESYFSNIVCEKRGLFFIPKKESGMYQGIMLGEWKKQFPDNFIEKKITKEFLRDCDKIYLCNALYGVRESVIIKNL